MLEWDVVMQLPAFREVMSDVEAMSSHVPERFLGIRIAWASTSRAENSHPTSPVICMALARVMGFGLNSRCRRMPSLSLSRAWV